MQFSWKRIFKIVGIIVLAGIAVAGIYFIANLRPVKIVVASLIFDNHEHYLSCEQLPFYPQVEKALSSHRDVVEKIRAAGAFDVSPKQIKCPSSAGSYYFLKGDIMIQYDTHSQRVAIEKLIGDNFFGIPYEGENH